MSYELENSPSIETLSISGIDSGRVFQRDTDVGNPTGFNTTFNKGWGDVSFTLTSSIAGNARIRLRDSTDPTKVVQNWMQLPINVTCGTNELHLTLPAGPQHYILDIQVGAEQSDVTTSVPFAVGTVDVAAGQSMATAFFEPYAYSPTSAPQPSTLISGISPDGVVFDPVNQQQTASDLNYTDWLPPGDYANKGYVTTFAAEYLRLRMAQTGVAAALIGYAAVGSAVASWAPGTPSNNLGTLEQTLQHAGFKFETFIWCQGSADQSTTLVPEYKFYLNAILHELEEKSDFSFRTVLFDYGWYGYADPQRLAKDIVLAKEDIAAESENTIYARGLSSTWYVTGHPTMISRIRGAQDLYRALLPMLDPNADHGPSLTGKAARHGAIIDLEARQDRGTKLVGTMEAELNATAISYTTATGEQLASQFSAFQSGFTDEAHRISVLSANIQNATTIRLTLASSPEGGVDVWYRTDEDTTAWPNWSAIIRDDVVDGDGIPYGRPLQPYDMAIQAIDLDAVSAAPPPPIIVTSLSLTRNRRQTVQGTAEVNSTVLLYDNGVSVASGVADQDGNWSFSTSLLFEGVNKLISYVKGSSESLSSASNVLKIVLDTTPFSSPVITSNDFITGKQMVTLSGRSDAGTILVFFDSNVEIGRVSVSPFSTVWLPNLAAWTADITIQAGDGPHYISTIAFDEAGNQSQKSNVVTVTLDTVAPSIPTISSYFSHARYSFLWVGGQAEPGSEVLVTEGGNVLGRGFTNDTGQWAASLTLNADGVHDIEAQAVDKAGNQSRYSAAFEYNLDTTPPAAPTLATLGGVVSSAVQEISGTAEANTTVQIMERGKGIGSALVGSDGRWVAQITFLTASGDWGGPTRSSEGPHIISAVATDAVGNVSLTSASITFALDTTLAGSLPADVAQSTAPSEAIADNEIVIPQTAVSSHEHTIVFEISNTRQGNDPVKFYVAIDGHKLPGIMTLAARHTSGQFQRLSVSGNLSDLSHTVAIQPVEAASIPNFAVGEVDVDGVQTTVSYTSGLPSVMIPGQAIKLSIGYSQDAGFTNGLGFLDFDNQFQTYVSVDAVHDSGTLSTASFSTSMTPDTHYISSGFYNDTTSPETGLHRTIYVESLDVGDSHMPLGLSRSSNGVDLIKISTSKLAADPSQLQVSLGQIETFGISTAPVIGGTRAQQAATSSVILYPFAQATLADADASTTDAETLTIQLANPTLGSLAGLTLGSYDSSTGRLTAQGTLSQLQTALRALTFSGNPGAESFTLTLDDGHGGITTDTTTSVLIASPVPDPVPSPVPVPVPNVAPVIGGARAQQASIASIAVHPFAQVTLTDADAATADIETLTIQLANPTLGSLAGLTLGSYDSSTGRLTAQGTLSQLQTALRALTFSGNPGTESFTLTLDDGHGGITTDTTTSVLIAAPRPVPVPAPAPTPNLAPSIGGARAQQAATASMAVHPFAQVTLTDADASTTDAETLTIQLANPTLGSLAGLALGSYDSSTGRLTAQGTLAQVQAALRALTFSGNPGTEGFTLTLDDGHGGITTDTTTSVLIATPAPGGERIRHFALSPTATVYTSTATGDPTVTQIETYEGPVSYLQSQFIYDGTETVAIAPQTPNVFIKCVAGSVAVQLLSGQNVVDAGHGSNFLVGGTGNDTFFLDARQSAETWDTIGNFHAGDMATIWGYDPNVSRYWWDDSAGASGWTGRTLRLDVTGSGHIEQSITFAGTTAADTTRYALTTGTVGGAEYMQIFSL